MKQPNDMTGKLADLKKETKKKKKRHVKLTEVTANSKQKLKPLSTRWTCLEGRRLENHRHVIQNSGCRLEKVSRSIAYMSYKCDRKK